VFLSYANATILINAETDKASLSTDEVGMLTVKLFNDSGIDEKNMQLTIKADEQIRLVEEKEELTILPKQINEIKSGKGTELRIKIKSISSKKSSANIYIYYGLTPQLNSAFVTSIQTKDLPINVTTKAEKKTLDEKDYAIINFNLTSYSNDILYNLAAEVIPPEGFEVTTAQPALKEMLKQNESFGNKFEVLAPMNARGTQTIMLAYGFFDNNIPHYFEKNFSMSFEKQNNQIIIIIAVAVIIIAGYLFLKKDEKNLVQGTKEK
jgi:hypothetical protein